MIARGFKSVIWVATVGSAALACYMVSLRVATERNELAKVDRQILEAKRDIRSLQTELGTRGRMAQLEQWNAEVLALSAPSSAQFLKDEFTLARLYRNDPTVAERSAQVRLASVESATAAKPEESAKPAAPAIVRAVAQPVVADQPSLVHRAGFTTEPAAKPKPKPKPAKPETEIPSEPASKPAKPAAQRTASAAPAKPEPTAGRTAAKTPAKPAIAAAKPVREPGAAVRDSKGAGGGVD